MGIGNIIPHCIGAMWGGTLLISRLIMGVMAKGMWYLLNLHLLTIITKLPIISSLTELIDLSRADRSIRSYLSYWIDRSIRSTSPGITGAFFLPITDWFFKIDFFKDFLQLFLVFLVSLYTNSIFMGAFMKLYDKHRHHIGNISFIKGNTICYSLLVMPGQKHVISKQTLREYGFSWSRD